MINKKCCIVSFGKGHNFKRGLERLKTNIEETVKIPFFPFFDYPEGCPTHEESPFAFKFFCIKECLKKGYDIIFWVDSSVVIKNNMADIFETLDHQGYFFIQNWHSVGLYCHDKALKTLNITRDESFNIPCVQGTQFGLNFNFDKCKSFLDKIISFAKDGVTFQGPYTNDDGLASADKRVEGHRHDQIPMSTVALKLGMNNWWSHEEHKWFIHDREYVKNTKSTVDWHTEDMSVFDIKQFCENNLNYYWEKDEIITGDNLEQLGQYIFDVENYIIGDHDREKIGISRDELALKYISEINELKPKVIYVYGHDTKIFLKYIENINYSFNLITHNSDLGVFKKYIPYSKRIKKWFGQTNYTTSEVISLPIGIARSKYPHGNIQLISEISKKTFKDILVYKSFSIETNLQQRNIINTITTNNGIKMSEHKNQEDYLNNISRSIFCICPPGNGVDCHRIWECLYLKCIPIIEYHQVFEQFKHLPICFIDDWNKVTVNFLRKNLQKIKELNKKHPELNFYYWKDKILNK